MSLLAIQRLGRNWDTPPLWIESQRLNQLGFSDSRDSSKEIYNTVTTPWLLASLSAELSSILVHMLIAIDPIIGKNVNVTCEKLMRESHWLHRYECPGRWQGMGAQSIGLKGSVRPLALRSVLQGMSPDGRVRLADDALEAGRQAGWLLRFMSPATVNALHGVSPAGVRKEIEKGHETAVKNALEQLENQIKETEGVSLVFAKYQHRVGEGQTPSLHTLIAASSVGFLDNGHAQNISGMTIKSFQQPTGEIYFESYVQQLENRLRLQMKSEPETFRIAGVPVEAAKSLEQSFGPGRGPLHDATQSWKNTSPDHASDLRARWNDFGKKEGWSTAEAKALVDHSKKYHKPNEQKTTSKTHGHSH